MFIRGGGDATAPRLHVARGLGLAIFGIAFVVAVGFFLAFAGARLVDQLQNLLDSVPHAATAVRRYIDAHDWMRRGIEIANHVTLPHLG